MDKIELYRKHICNLLDEYASHRNADSTIEVEKIIDAEHDHYEIISVGWNGNRRVHGSPLHIDIRNGKIWIQHDGTEEGVANRFVEWGVPKQDIVLGFQSPYMRKFTEFAVG